jgi:hypothetical protein
MSESSNIVIEETNAVFSQRIYLYGHWMGEESIQVVWDTLTRYRRWDDQPYFTRMLFSRMVRDDIDGELGYGISLSRYMTDYPDIVLRPSDRLIWLESDKGEELTPRMKYEEFISQYDEGHESFAQLINKEEVEV